MKFPKTYHLPNSPNRDRADKIHDSIDFFCNRFIVFTEKLDGENQCWSRHNFHLRSETSHGDALRSHSKATWASISYLIPENLLVFVEDISNVHSIEYPSENRDKCFVIAMHDTLNNYWLDWDTTKYLANTLNLPTVPELYKCNTVTSCFDFDETLIQLTAERLAAQQTMLYGIKDGKKVENAVGIEGVVIRLTSSFTSWTFSTAKYVRANHVQTTDDWTQEQYKKLRKNEQTHYYSGNKPSWYTKAPDYYSGRKHAKSEETTETGS